MSPVWSALLAAVAAPVPAGAAVAVVQTPIPAQSGSLRLTPAEMFRLADLSIAKGDGATAAAIYAALQQNPDSDIRAEARFREAKQLMQQGRNSDAAILLRRVLDDRPEATGVRLELAHLLQILGDPDGALRQVRAAQSAGLPPEVARLVDRYSDALRAARPMGASLEIALAPDSNINHATRSDTLGTIFGDFDIDENSKAESGTGLSLRGEAYRRIPLGSGDHSLLGRASAFADLYGKSRFNDIAIDAAAGPELRLGRTRLNLELGATQRWFGQKPFARSLRLGASAVRPVGGRSQVRLEATAALVDNQFNDLQDGRAFSGRVEFEHALSPAMGVALNLSLDRQSLKDPGYSTTGWRAGFVGWRDFGRMTFTLGAELGRLKADERLALFAHTRSDRYSSFTLGATFRQLGFRGFAPVMRFAIERNRSTIEFYDYSRKRTELAIVRAF